MDAVTAQAVGETNVIDPAQELHNALGAHQESLVEVARLRAELDQANAWLLDATRKAEVWFGLAQKYKDSADVLDAIGTAIDTLRAAR